MDDKIRAALVEAAERAGAIDPVIVDLASLGEIVGTVRIENDVVVGVDAAVAAMKSAKPDLFRGPDWAKLAGSEFTKKAAALLDGLRVKSARSDASPHPEIDSAQLSAEDFEVVTQALRGERTSYNENRIESIAARQHAETKGN